MCVFVHAFILLLEASGLPPPPVGTCLSNGISLSFWRATSVRSFFILPCLALSGVGHKRKPYLGHHHHSPTLFCLELSASRRRSTQVVEGFPMSGTPKRAFLLGEFLVFEYASSKKYRMQLPLGVSFASLCLSLSLLPLCCRSYVRLTESLFYLQ